MVELAVIIATIAAKVASYTIGPIGRYIVRPIAHRCPFKNVWEYKSNLENMKTELKNLEAKRESVQGLTNVGVEPLPDINDWLDKATNVINEVSGLISEDNPEKGCCEGCTYSNLKESYQHRINVARKLKDVAQLLQEALRSMSLWEYRSNLENLKNEVEKLVARRESVQLLIKDGEEPLPHVKAWQESVDSIINMIPGLVNENNPEHQNNVARKLKDVAQLLQEAREFREVSIISEETVYKINLENLRKEVEKLEAKRDSVKCSIKAGEEPLPDVKLWQDKVNSIINEVSGLTSQHNHQQQNNVARMLNDVTQLLQEVREFRKLSFRPIPEETWLQSSEGYKAFESRTSILKEIVEALSKPDVNLVGIYGMGGIGKTMLAKQVARQTIQDKVFNKIVFVEVSQTPNMKKIQREIGSKLGLKFYEQDELSERARQLYQQLKNEEKTLLILDNVWESLNFETMGIPYNHDSKGLKLLMTARKSNVLTDGIEYSQHNFSIEALEWEDAWSFFKSKAGTCVDRCDLLPIAVDVAKECGGVPIAIVTMAKALNNREAYEWRKVLRELRNPSPHSFDGIAANVYRSIELSYNYLETKEHKATFLLCSSIGSTYDASIEDLLRYGIGLGLFNRFNTMEEERDNVCSLVNTLKASSLLVDAPKSGGVVFPNIERFAMHDVVCDVARSIARKNKNVFSVIDDVIPRSWESENMLRNCTSIMLDNVNKLSKDLQLVCPQLKFLYVKPRLLYSKISEKFFAWMPSLQVLHLIEMDLRPLSTPFSDLVNLQTLCLEDCMLKDIADIGDLKNLEILSFCGCKYFKLPEKLHQLTKLRLLELDCIGLTSVPSKFILSFKKLEALYMRDTTIEWEAEKSFNGSWNTSRDVLEHFSNLTSLEICVPEIPEAIMLRRLLSPKLERYNITIGEISWSEYGSDWDIRCKTSRFLQVMLNTNEDGTISRLKAIRQLVLDEVPGIANNFCALDRMGFLELEDLKVQNNSHILHIVDTVSRDGIFPILKLLILENLINLKTICNGPLGIELFHQLRTIKVGDCHALTNIFSLAGDRVFQELEEIEVCDCENMEEIFAISDQVHEIKFSILRNLKLTFLPQLESFCCNLKTTTPILQSTSDTKPIEIILEEEQDVPKPFFNEKVVVTNLETLEIDNINVNSIWDNQLPTMASIPNLTCLIISNLANLRRLGSGDYIKFPLLREMRIQNCPKFKEIFFDDKVGVPSLEKIEVFKMDNLKMIWHNQLVEDSFPKLKSLQVKECQKLLTLFRSNMFGSFLGLETLNVSECGSLEEILDLRRINSEESHPTTSTRSRLSFTNLQNLEVSYCLSLKTIVAKEEIEAREAPGTARFVFPKLTSLVLYKLPELRTFYPNRYTTEWPALKTLMIHQHEIGVAFFWPSNIRVQRVNSAYQSPSFWPNEVGFEFRVQKIWPNLLSILSSWVRNLTKLILYGCDNLEELFPYSMVVTKELREKKTGNTIIFPKLNYLGMKQLANLKGLCSRCHIEFPTLEEFEISDCPELTTFIFDDKVKVPSLKKVKISSMDTLMKIWDNQLSKNSIPKLEFLQADGCQKLLTLLPLDMCESFSSLETLNVRDCGSLEKIFDLHEINSEERHSTTSTQSKELYTTVLSFANLQNLEVSECGSLKSLFSVSNVAKNRGTAEGTYPIARFFFPKLTFLKLYNLPKLRTFYPGRYTVEWPVLRTLGLCDCGTSDTDDEDQMQNSLFLVEKAISCLEELILSGRQLMMMWQGQDPEPLFRNFKILVVLDEPEVDYFSIADRPVLRYIGDVKFIWKQNFKLDLILPNFKKIRVTGCDNFISLMPPSASFQNLTSLEVYHCDSLEHIGTFSMAKTLVKLEQLKIWKCKKIVEILGNHGDVIGDKILFSNLKSLSLVCLPSLTSFCSQNFTLEFPSLEEVDVYYCPNMKIFSQGVLTTPKLRKVEMGFQSVELRPDINVNTAIQQSHEQRVQQLPPGTRSMIPLTRIRGRQWKTRRLM